MTMLSLVRDGRLMATDPDAPVSTPPVRRYQCCHCGDTCPHCEGLGFC